MRCSYQTSAPCIHSPFCQVFVTFCPGVQSFFDMPDALDGVGWARALVGMVVIYAIVEVEKVSGNLR